MFPDHDNPTNTGNGAAAAARRNGSPNAVPDVNSNANSATHEATEEKNKVNEGQHQDGGSATGGATGHDGPVRPAKVAMAAHLRTSTRR